MARASTSARTDRPDRRSDPLYLNGGIFCRAPDRAGQLLDIQIPDDAFERIFDFFDAYQWHLDDGLLYRDNEINPEVLGYVFENTPTRRRWEPTTPRRTSPNTSRRTPSCPSSLQKAAP
ncbi:MAG: hypothetical protein R3F11_15155 [Verrucomicrobiales bacterium]